MPGLTGDCERLREVAGIVGGCGGSGEVARDWGRLRELVRARGRSREIGAVWWLFCAGLSWSELGWAGLCCAVLGRAAAMVGAWLADDRVVRKEKEEAGAEGMPSPRPKALPRRRCAARWRRPAPPDWRRPRFEPQEI